MAYDPGTIEPRWQEYWQKHSTFRAEDGGDKPKYYVLDMFPYPSGDGLHVGHPEGYTATDVVARWKRMQGFNVLHPMGWDAFGMPAENAAIANHSHPAKWTYQNIDNMRSELKRVGFSYDWDREIATCKEDYYKWNQWLFIQMFKKGIAYKKDGDINAFNNFCQKNFISDDQEKEEVFNKLSGYFEALIGN